ncbi:toprim domain-containing protein [Pseudomonas mohnii]
MNTIKQCASTGGIGLSAKPELAFLEVLQSVYGQLDFNPIADGTIHRFKVPADKSGSLNGWYVLYLDYIASGAFGSWKAGDNHTWSSREPADHREADQLRERIEQAKAQRETERRQKQQAAAELANRWWRNARRADPDHPYLIAKGVRGHGLRQRGVELLVPLYSNGQLVNLQRISADGTKRFLSGGQVRASYSALGTIGHDKPLIVCEGWATGATLHRSGYTVAAAMNAGNLKPVAMALRVKYPGVEIVIAGDDDRTTEGNPGRTAATSAALAVGGDVCFPEWPEDAPLELSDFNDLFQWRASNGN